MSEQLTKQVAGFVREISYDALPKEAIEKAKLPIVDCVASALAGVADEAGQIIGQFAKAARARPEAAVLGQGFRTSPELAALANGTLAHALDYDDMSSAMVHPSAPVLPVVLALGDQLRIDGKTALLAYSTGVEVELRLGRIANPHHYELGWHATGTLGTFGACAAASKLLSLTEEQIRMALGIAASLAGGIRQNFGTMTKPLHVGNAARHGLEAALLAKAGFTGDGSILDAPRGFFHVFCAGDGHEATQVSFAVDQPLEIVTPGIGIKRYASCGGTHPALDALFALMEEHPFAVDDVARVRCGVYRLVPDILIHHSPKTGLQGKFSMEYCLAVALVDRKAGSHQFSDERVADAHVQEVLRRVEVYVDKSTGEVPGPWPSTVTVTLTDGREYSKRVAIARGDAREPLAAGEVADKYLECAEGVLSRSDAERSLEMLQSLEKVQDLHGLADILLGGHQT